MASLFPNLEKQIEEDLKMDPVELDTESLRIPQLHNKYLVLLNNEKAILRSLENDMSFLFRMKWEYYTGKISPENLKKYGWEPFQLKILKGDLDIYLRSDEQLQNMGLKVDLQKQKVEYIESVIKGIMNRHWQIRSTIEWRKFTNGAS
jgi:hypothetical protein